MSRWLWSTTPSWPPGSSVPPPRRPPPPLPCLGLEEGPPHHRNVRWHSQSQTLTWTLREGGGPGQADGKMDQGAAGVLGTGVCMSQAEGRGHLTGLGASFCRRRGGLVRPRPVPGPALS